ncbi:Cyclase-like protein 1 [Cardamine amara subsp. amara]|uniref:Cyclase-like protein 1 n=1 Tax=Cardamine amara subsp. amara TaxID=228776 RepID=A0ABD1BBR0_CARAN
MLSLQHPTLTTSGLYMFKKEFDSIFAGFMNDRAKWLVEDTYIKLIGLDYLSFPAFEESPVEYMFLYKSVQVPKHCFCFL